VNSATKTQPQTVLILWTLLVVYAAARVLQVFPGKIALLAIVALHVLPPMAFAVIHGAVLYRLRGMVTFIAICLFVGSVFENLSIRTGFPFGHYYFTDLMGPKIFAVPILLGFAYVGMAYLSWTLGALILGDPETPLRGHRVVTLPLVASFIMVAWDLSMDPVWSAIMHAWFWRDGGAYFGVPVSNFLGWYLTVYVVYQCFALYLRGRARPVNPVAAELVAARSSVLRSICGRKPSCCHSNRRCFDGFGPCWRTVESEQHHRRIRIDLRLRHGHVRADRMG
jgi:uncharacterized membrane protein